MTKEKEKTTQLYNFLATFSAAVHLALNWASRPTYKTNGNRPHWERLAWLNDITDQ